ncbi:MAG: FAD-dependent monooxygenase [Roseiarcus sp.]
MSEASDLSKPFDIAVAGAGPAGLAFAAALKQALGKRLRILLIDPKLARDGRVRTVALAKGSRKLLERVGAWSALAALSQPIHEMAIYDGLARDAVRIPQMRFSERAEEPLAHMAYNDDLADALAAICDGLGVETARAAVQDFAPGPTTARLALSDGREARARLVVAADGARSKLRGLAGIPTYGRDTGQTGIVATIAHERDHGGRAEQHFLPGGPFAILPMPGRFSSIVWNERHDEAKALLALDEEDFLRQLEPRFTLKLGAISLASRVEGYPFSFRIARRFVAPRLALVADAAHIVHPLAGLGLNLGLRDVAALAERVVEPLRLGLDPGEPSTLEAYERDRRFDVIASEFGMDAMLRLFSNDFAPLRSLRDFGLRIVDRAPALKRAFMAEAAGAGPRASRLSRGLGL